MGRTVRDTALMLDAMAGSHPGDPLALPAPLQPFADAAAPDDRPRRVAYSRDLGVSPIHKGVTDACDKAVEQLAKAGWQVTEDIPDFSVAMETFHAIRAARFAAGHEIVNAATQTQNAEYVLARFGDMAARQRDCGDVVATANRLDNVTMLLASGSKGVQVGDIEPDISLTAVEDSAQQITQQPIAAEFRDNAMQVDSDLHFTQIVLQ